MTVTMGVDLHPWYQRFFNFDQALRQGVRFGFIKITQGNRYVPDNLLPFFRRARQLDQLGLYHFGEAGSSGKEQADHFLTVAKNQCGGVKGKLVAFDFEDYGSRDAQASHMDEFGKRIEAAGGRFLWDYSTKSWWESHNAGSLSSKDARGMWEAKVWYTEEQREDPLRFFNHNWYPWYKQEYKEGKAAFGGVNPLDPDEKAGVMFQATWGGHLGGLYVDTDFFMGSFDELKKTVA